MLLTVLYLTVYSCTPGWPLSVFLCVSAPSWQKWGEYSTSSMTSFHRKNLYVYLLYLATLDSNLSLQKRKVCMWLSQHSVLATSAVSLYTNTLFLSLFPPHQKPKDPHLALFVCALVAVDVVILLLFTLVEGLQGNLEPSMVPNTENPSDTRGVSIYRPEKWNKAGY